MIDDEVIILHEYGAPEHYTALIYLLKNNNIKSKFYEFSITKQLLKSCFQFDIKLFKKQLKNISNLVSLAFSKNKKVILGIAPYDYRLYFILLILKNHTVYYHTSWPHWDGSNYPKKSFVSNKLIKLWNIFLQKKSKHIFVVTEGIKKELNIFKHIDLKKISVVYHSYNSNIFYNKDSNLNSDITRIVFVGRLTESKGIKQIINFFNSNKNLEISFVGRGDLQHQIEVFSSANECIKYYGYLSNKLEIAKIYRESDYMLLPSIKQSNWEEAFGMVIIEAMACGVIPICTKHPGPLEIITNKDNGYLINELHIEQELTKIFQNINKDTASKIKISALEKAKMFTIENISLRWKNILDD